MEPRGRRILTSEHPSGERAKFAWLVRAIRITHPDQSLRDTNEFRNRLASRAYTDLAVDTINKYETGQLEFSLERCMQFEDALELNHGDLVDPYCYLYRVHNRIPKSKELARGDPAPPHIETIYRIGSGEAVDGIEWLRIAMLYRRSPEIFDRIKERIAERFFVDLAGSYEREERLLLEAAVFIRPLLAPHVQKLLEADSSRLFNLVESMGHEPDEESIGILESVAEMSSNHEFLAPTLLEATGRINNTKGVDSFNAKTTNMLSEYARKALCSDGIFYCAQEESLDYLRSVSIQLNLRQTRSLESRNVDLRQLIPTPIGFSKTDLRRAIQLELENHLSANTQKDTVNLPLLPGICSLLMDALIGGNRRSRLSISVMLHPWNGASLVTEILGQLLRRVVPDDSFGVRRAAIRAITKIGSDDRINHIIKLSSQDVNDDGSACMLAWSLGSAFSKAAQEALTNLYRVNASASTKRAILVASRRQSNLDLLAKMQLDTNTSIAHEASTIIESLRFPR